MEEAWNEGLRTVNDIPLSIECLLLSREGEQDWRAPHYHEYVEILYVLEGEYELKLNGTVTRLPRHSMFVLLPGEPHCTRRLCPTQSLLCIKFLPQVLYSSEPDSTALEHAIPFVLERFSQRRLFDPDTLKGTPIPGAFEALRREQLEPRFGYELALRSHVLQIFLWIFRHWHETAGSPPLTLPNATAAVILSRAREYVRENYATASLSGVARACGLSYGYFSRLFSTYMKTSFNSYVNLVRVERSRQLLVSTDMSITEIALTVGFSSTSHYIQTFRRHQSISPNRYRKLFCSGAPSSEPL
ncbi:MAG: helix-turn-helix transcriptional regulator [Oscillospiraceae bacterium]|nr:helix-turn-helix transcriptional regulator [Oscillospiraceae bacterium]